MKKYLTISRVLFEKWNYEGIRYCHWKSTEHLLAGLNGETDLDILVLKSDKEKCEKILRELYFMLCKSQYGATYDNVYDWIGFDNCTGKLIHIHLHYKLITGHKGIKEYSLPWTELAIETRILDSDYNVYVIDPSLELITLYSRICIKKTFFEILNYRLGKRFKLSIDDAREISFLKNKMCEENLKNFLSYYFSEAQSILYHINMDSFTTIEFLKLRKMIKKSLLRERKQMELFSLIREIYYWFVINLRGVLRKYLKINMIYKKTPYTSRGKIIAFVGQDGSGKSTVTSELKKWLEWKLDVRYYYLGSGEQYKSVYKSIGNILKPLRKNWLINVIYGCLVVLDCRKISRNYVKQLNHAFQYSSKGGIALLDRFPQNKVGGYNDGPRISCVILPKIRSKFFKLFLGILANEEEKNIKKASLIQPDLAIKLILSPEESIKRKPGESLETIRKKHNFIKTWDLGRKSYEVDASLAYEEEILDIKRKIWECLMEM